VPSAPYRHDWALGAVGEDCSLPRRATPTGGYPSRGGGTRCSRASCRFLGKTRRVAEVPETRYAKSGGLHIAYQAMGDGPPDVVFIPEWSGHVELRWEEPRMARFLQQMASMGRMLIFDKRGVGLSDPVSLSELPSLEEWADDVLTVMDDAGSDRAALVAVGQGGPMAMVFAATHPGRTAALVLVNSNARLRLAPDYPWGAPPSVEERLQASPVYPGPGAVPAFAKAFFGSDAAADERFLAWWRRYARMASSPGAWAVMQQMLFDVDVRDVLPTIRVPTLVVHRRDDAWIQVGHGRFLAEHIPGAKYVELDGSQHQFFLGDTTRLLDEIAQFVAGRRRPRDVDRVLATVLFTDIVASTRRAADLGDHEWRNVLDAHDDVVRQELERFRGREVKMTGDGTLATFDGPARAVRCACSIREEVRALGIDMRAGLHTGEVELRERDVTGIGVHIAARIDDLAQPGEILVSSTVKDLVAGSGITFADRGVHVLRGVPDEWHLLAVENA
jgi:pimeloyl-ACP methyl ester carboxylesterase